MGSNAASRFAGILERGRDGKSNDYRREFIARDTAQRPPSQPQSSAHIYGGSMGSRRSSGRRGLFGRLRNRYRRISRDYRDGYYLREYDLRRFFRRRHL